MPKEYIDVTPTWSAILPIWRRIVEDAVTVEKPEQLERFWSEMETMAAAADRWNEECKLQHEAADEEQK